MTRFGKFLLAAVAISYGAAFCVALLAAVFVYRTCRNGTAIVRVHEKRPHGTHLWLPIPVGLVRTAAAFVPAHELPPIDAEAKLWLPAVRNAVAELERAPDGVLVEVQSPDEHVVLAKRGNRLTIDVDTAGESVSVSVPAGLVFSVLGDLERFPTESRHRWHRGRRTGDEI